MKGYFGIGCENLKTPENYGTLLRSAHAMGAKFIFLIGMRFKKQSTDTSKAYNNIPLFMYDTVEDFYNNLPHGCQLIGVENDVEVSWDLKDFKHPKCAAYLLGAEDHGLTSAARAFCHSFVHIRSEICLNVATAGSIVIYDRQSKQ